MPLSTFACVSLAARPSADDGLKAPPKRARIRNGRLAVAGMASPANFHTPLFFRFPHRTPQA